MDEMNVMKIQVIMRQLPYIEKEKMDDKVYGRLTELKKTLESRGENDCHQLHKGNVTGLWYLSSLTYDGEPQLIMRSSVKSGTYERLLLNGEIFDIVVQDVIYDYDKDLIKGGQMIKGEQEELFRELIAGRAFTIYDKEREE